MGNRHGHERRQGEAGTGHFDPAGRSVGYGFGAAGDSPSQSRELEAQILNFLSKSGFASSEIEIGQIDTREKLIDLIEQEKDGERALQFCLRLCQAAGVLEWSGSASTVRGENEQGRITKFRVTEYWSKTMKNRCVTNMDRWLTRLHDRTVKTETGRSPPLPLPLPSSALLDPHLLFALSFANASAEQALQFTPDLLFSLAQSGESFIRFCGSVAFYPGPTLILIKSKPETPSQPTTPSISSASKDGVFGAFLVGELKDHGSGFFGGKESFLFSTQSGELAVFAATTRSDNIAYFNARNPQAQKGLGFGGSENEHRLLVHEDLRRVTATIACGVYQPGSLVPSADEYRRTLDLGWFEIWGCGGAPALATQRAAQERDLDLRADARKIDRAKMFGQNREMFKKTHAGDRQAEVDAIVEEHRELS